MKKRQGKENTDMNNATIIGVIFCLFIYLLTGILGFFMYRNELNNVVLDNLRNEIKDNLNKDNFIASILILVNISFLISSTMSIPLMFFSLKTNFISLIIVIKKYLYRKKINSKNESIVDNHESTEKLHFIEKKKWISKHTKFIISFVLYILMILTTITVKNMKEIFDIVGSTAGNSINYIFPNLFFLKISQNDFCNCKNIFSKFLSVIGCVILVLCLTTEIIKLITY